MTIQYRETPYGVEAIPYMAADALKSGVNMRRWLSQRDREGYLRRRIEWPRQIVRRRGTPAMHCVNLVMS